MTPLPLRAVRPCQYRSQGSSLALLPLVIFPCSSSSSYIDSGHDLTKTVNNGNITIQARQDYSYVHCLKYAADDALIRIAEYKC